jgi:hypothetical protein
LKEVNTEDGFYQWLKRAKTGEKVVYFDGFLMLERQKHLLNNAGVEFPQKIKTAMFAWRTYLEGLVELVQRKRDEGEYEYIAVRR